MFANILSKYKSALSLALTITISLSSLIWQSNVFSRTVNKATIVFDFFTETFQTIGSGFTDLFDSYGNYQDIKLERDLLKQKLKQYQNERLRFLQLRSENQRLHKLVQIPENPKYEFIKAEVISQDPDNWFRTIIINKGSANGIKPYMPVIATQVITKRFVNEEKDFINSEVNPKNKKTSTDTNVPVKKEILIQAIVGKIIQVNKYSSRILPISDQYSRLGVILKRTDHWAMLVGQNPYKKMPRLDYLSLSVFPMVGEEIVTSGGEGIFPKGLLVGYIGRKIERLGGFQKTDVIPAIDHRKLHYVMVIKKERNLEMKDFPDLLNQNKNLNKKEENK